MAAVFFFIAALGAIAGALGVVGLRNAFYSVLALVCHLLSLAALFLLLRAQFVAAAQVIVYAGAVMVLYVFVVSYVAEAGIGMPLAGGGRMASYLFAAALAAELMIAMLGSGLQAIDTEGAPFDAGFGTPGQIGTLLLTKFLFPFEAASFLLLMAAVGAVVLARRRGGAVGDRDRPVLSVMDMIRDERLGTMAETVAAGSGRAAVGAAMPSGRDIQEGRERASEDGGGW
jgi:NADH:ubiquinone oxidoreductase subunit 6 (subunit J)